MLCSRGIISELKRAEPLRTASFTYPIYVLRLGTHTSYIRVLELACCAAAIPVNQLSCQRLSYRQVKLQLYYSKHYRILESIYRICI